MVSMSYELTEEDKKVERLNRLGREIENIQAERLKSVIHTPRDKREQVAELLCDITSEWKWCMQDESRRDKWRKRADQICAIFKENT